MAGILDRLRLSSLVRPLDHLLRTRGCQTNLFLVEILRRHTVLACTIHQLTNRQQVPALAFSDRVPARLTDQVHLIGRARVQVTNKRMFITRTTLTTARATIHQIMEINSAAGVSAETHTFITTTTADTVDMGMAGEAAEALVS